MRLIRLATENNATFDVNFDTPITIEANSQLALQNTTFERAFDIMEVTTANRKMTMKYPELVLDKAESNIPLLTINTQAEQDDFFLQISGAMNKLLLDISPSDGGGGNQSVFGGSEWLVARHPKRHNDIEIKLCLTPLVSPFLGLPTNSATRFAERGIFGRDVDDYNYETSFVGALDIGDRFSMKTGVARTTDRTNVIEMNEGISFCAGSGTFTVQIENSVNNTLGSPLTTNNGFGMGLLLGKQTIPDGLDFTDADVDFEIYFNRVGENYTMINGKGTGRVDTGILPHKVTTAGHLDVGVHDIIGITIEDNGIVLFISQDNGQPASNVAITPITNAQRIEIQKFGIQAYMYFNDTENFIKIANARVTPSPFVSFGNHNIQDDNVAIFAKSRDLSVRGLAVNHYLNLPWRYNAENETNIGISRFDKRQTFNLEISESILRYMGFTRAQHFVITDTLTIENGMFLVTADADMSFTFSDFFIVESQSLQLDSYNAVADERLSVGLPARQSLNASLKGDRMSILATIPINDSLGEVAFETNTPVFIDIKNINETNIRNLRFRILDGENNPIKTTATTNMTLLIKGPNE